MYYRSHDEAYLERHQVELSSVIDEAERLLPQGTEADIAAGYLKYVTSVSLTYPRDNLAIIATAAYAELHGRRLHDSDVVDTGRRLAEAGLARRRAEYVGGAALQVTVSRTELSLPDKEFTAVGYLVTEEASGVGQETYIVSANDDIYAAGTCTNPVFADDDGWTVVKAGQFLNFGIVSDILEGAAVDPESWQEQYGHHIQGVNSQATLSATWFITSHATLMRDSPIPLRFGSGAPDVAKLTHTWHNLTELSPADMVGT